MEKLLFVIPSSLAVYHFNFKYSYEYFAKKKPQGIAEN